MAEPSTVSQNYDDLVLVPFSSSFMRWILFLLFFFALVPKIGSLVDSWSFFGGIHQAGFCFPDLAARYALCLIVSAFQVPNRDI